MAFENLGKVINLLADADLSAKQYRFVTIDSSGGVIVATSGADAIGVTQNNPASGKSTDVMVGIGITKIVAGEAMPAGAPVSADSTGRGQYAATGEYTLGRLLEAATAAGDIVAMLFQPQANVR